MALTNKQAGANLVKKKLEQMLNDITAMDNHAVAEIAEKQRINDTAADQVRGYAADFVQPLLDRVSRLCIPRTKKEDETEDATLS